MIMRPIPHQKAAQRPLRGSRAAGQPGAVPSRRLSPHRPVALLLACTVVTAVSCTAVHADGFAAGMAVGIAQALAFFLLIAVVVVTLFCGSILLIEALGLNYYLKLGLWPCLGCALPANLLSAIIGLIWYYAGNEEGWKTAVAIGELASIAPLFLRSFLVTLVGEGLLLVLILRKYRDVRTILKAVLLANALSYLLSAVLTPFWAPVLHVAVK